MTYKGIDKIDTEVKRVVEAKKLEAVGIREYVETCVEYSVCPSCGKELKQIQVIDVTGNPEETSPTIGPTSIMTSSKNLRVRLVDQCVGCGWLNQPR